MNTHTDKMSLVAKYDDLMRLTVPITAGYEDQFIRFIQQEVEVRKYISTLKEENANLKVELSKMRSEKEKLETKMKHTKFLLEDEIAKKTGINSQRKCLQRQISIIRDVLMADHTALNDETKAKLAFLGGTNLTFNPLDTIDESTGLLSSSDYSDFTDEEQVDGSRRVKRKSKGRRRSSQGKRRSSQGKRESFQTNHIPEQGDGPNVVPMECDAEFTNKSFQANRCYSEPSLPNSVAFNPPRQVLSTEVSALEESKLTTENIQEILQNTRLSLGKKERRHSFVIKTMIRPESCSQCSQKIKFYKPAVKCQDCRITCHPECKDKVTSSCTRNCSVVTKKKTMISLMDFAYHNSPMIPEIIIQCTSVIESNGLNEQGLYRISGREKDLKEIRIKLLEGKCIPCLGNLDLHTVCCVVKEFFRLLEEPLVVRSLWKEFSKAVKMPVQVQRIQLFCGILDKLPQPNKETLAFMALHLNRVAESPKCMMPIANLAKMFGPTIIGHSADSAATSDALADTKFQCSIMENLLKIPLKFWEKILLFNNDNVDDSVFSFPTPETRTSPAFLRQGTKLGPISGQCGKTARKAAAVRLDKTTLTPRKSAVMANAKKGKKFFPSP